MEVENIGSVFSNIFIVLNPVVKAAEFYSNITDGIRAISGA